MTTATAGGQPDEQDLMALAGGVEGLRGVVRAFYDALFDDVMIGFMFWGLDKEHLIEREVELTARFLGSREVSYQGRPLREAHARHQITGGQFHRRLQLLREAMEARGVAEPVREAWVRHTLALRGQVTREAGSACHTQGEP